MMYLDANFFIFVNALANAKGDKARTVLKEIIDGKKAITSVLALDEVMWVVLRNKQSILLQGIIQDIYAIKNLEVKEVPSIIPLRALDFMAKYQLRPRDGFHVAVMEYFGVTTIVSDDSDFDRIPNVKRIKL